MYEAFTAFEKALCHLKLREGFKLKVYRDTLGIPTVGVGHVVRVEDNLKVGDTITEERCNAFLARDAANAFTAACSQLIELGFYATDFLVALTSVNFQLGTKWTNRFPNTWNLIKTKRYDQAIQAIGTSLWAKQTPVRAKDFQDALRKLRSN